MHTIETAIVLPIIILFTAVIMLSGLKYTQAVSKHADSVAKDNTEHSISNTDIARAGDTVYEIYEKYRG